MRIYNAENWYWIEHFQNFVADTNVWSSLRCLVINLLAFITLLNLTLFLDTFYDKISTQIFLLKFPYSFLPLSYTHFKREAYVSTQVFILVRRQTTDNSSLPIFLLWGKSNDTNWWLRAIARINCKIAR